MKKYFLVISLGILCFLCGMVADHFTLKNTTDLSNEILLLDTLNKESYDRFLRIKGGEMFMNTYKEMVLDLKKSVEIITESRTDSSNFAYSILDKYKVHENYFNFFKSELIKENSQENIFRTKLLEYIALNKLINMRNSSLFKFDLFGSLPFTKKNVISLGEEYNAMIYCYVVNTQAPVIAVLDNGDTIKNETGIPCFTELPTKRGQVVHSGKLYVFQADDYISSDFKIEYNVK